MSAFTDVLRSYADRAHDNLTYRTMVPEHVLRDAAAVIDDYRERRSSLIDELVAGLVCEDPEEPCDADGRDEHRWCDNCIARAAALALAAKLREDPR